MPQEQVQTPERTPEELYLDTLEKKRDTLLAFHTMNSFRKGKEPGEMNPEEIERYKVLREEWRTKKESSFSSFENLSQDKQDKLAAMGSRLYDVQAELTLLRPKETLVPDVSGEKTEEAPPVRPEDTKEKVEEKPESGLTLEEAERMLKYSKDTGRILELAYWESKVAELKERQEAEANPDKTVPKGFTARVKKFFSPANAISGDDITVESRMSPLGLRKEAIESVPDNQPAAEETPAEVKPQKEAEPRRPTKWGWLKERAKGVWNFGIWEFHQAERFRRKTREVAEDVKALTTLIQEERTLSLENAQKEAQEIMDTLKEKGLEISALEITKFSNDLSERKRQENDEEIEYIIQSADNDLLEKLKKYRGEAGQDVLTEENKIAFQRDLRTELDKLRDGFLKNYTVDLAKVMRLNLDEKWWRRYVWGAAEAALGFAAVKFLITKFSAAEAAKAVAGGPEAAKEFVTQTMDQNVWHTLKEMAQNGPQHLNLSDQQLMDLSKKVLDTNGMYESEWVNRAVEGLRSSRILPQGLPLKIPFEVMRVLGY